MNSAIVDSFIASLRHAVFKAEPADAPDLVGAALRGAKRDVDKTTRGLAMHP